MNYWFTTWTTKDIALLLRQYRQTQADRNNAALLIIADLFEEGQALAVEEVKTFRKTQETLKELHSWATPSAASTPLSASNPTSASAIVNTRMVPNEDESGGNSLSRVYHL